MSSTGSAASIATCAQLVLQQAAQKVAGFPASVTYFVRLRLLARVLLLLPLQLLPAYRWYELFVLKTSRRDRAARQHMMGASAAA
jgi:hypothetical protein